MHARHHRWLPFAVAVTGALAIWTLAAAGGYAWQLIWLPAAIAGAAWPGHRKHTLRRSRRHGGCP